MRPPRQTTDANFIYYVRKTPFTLVQPYLWLTVGLNVLLFLFSTVMIWASPAIPAWIGVVAAVLFLLHSILIFVAAALEIFAPAGSFMEAEAVIILFGLFFLYSSTISAFANMYGALNKVQAGAFLELNQDMSAFDQIFRVYYLSVDVFTGIATGWVIPESRLARGLILIHSIFSHLTFLFIIGNVTDVAIKRAKHPNK